MMEAGVGGVGRAFFTHRPDTWVLHRQEGRHRSRFVGHALIDACQ
jgi:hypothetical protein